MRLPAPSALNHLKKKTKKAKDTGNQLAHRIKRSHRQANGIGIGAGNPGLGKATDKTRSHGRDNTGSQVAPGHSKVGLVAADAGRGPHPATWHSLVALQSGTAYQQPNLPFIPCPNPGTALLLSNVAEVSSIPSTFAVFLGLLCLAP